MPVGKRKVKILEAPNELNDKQRLFAWLYVSDRDCFANATRSYMAAYEMENSQYDTARTNGTRLLANARIAGYINDLLDKQFEDKEVDRALALAISQNKDMRSKVAAIGEYNKLKARITDKVDLTSKGEPITGINYILPNGNFGNSPHAETTPGIPGAR